MSYIREDGVFSTDVTATVVGTDPFTVGYEMQYRSNSGAAWREFGGISSDGVFSVPDIALLNASDGVTGDLVMDARFRAVNDMGARGDWSGVKAYSLARSANQGPQAGATANERLWDHISTDNVGSLLGLRKARGSLGSETAVIASDVAGSLDYYAHDGTQYDLIGRFQVLVAAISAGDISSTIVLKNTDAGGSLNPGMTIDPDGAVQLSGVSIDGGFVDERDVSADGAALDLVVAGTFSNAITVTLASANYGYTHQSTGGLTSLATYISDSTGAWLGTRTNDDLNLYVNDGSAALTIDTGSLVGIGTTTPSDLLHLKAASGNVALNIETTAGAWRLNNNAGAASLNIGVSGGTTPVKIRTTAATNLLRIGQSSTTSIDLNGDLNGTGYIKTGSVAVASLPSAVTAGAGARHFVSDATSATFLATAVGGGSNKVPVISDGTSWLIGG